MTTLSRFAFRLRRRLLRWYEFGLCVLLLAMALAAAMPAASSDTVDPGARCGQEQGGAADVAR